jgi:hypothetical protein
VRRGAALAALAGHALVLGPGWSAPRAFGAELVERIGANAAFLARPGAVRADLEADRAAKRIEYGLPRVRERAGREAVDVLGAAQGVAFLNDLAYTPRPVFQSYAAYTPELQELNRRFFTSARAPRWVLFGSSAIDDHLPAIEDAAAFAVISRDFRVELEERGWLLLAKREPPPPVTDVGSFVVSRTARFGERLDFASLLPASATPPRVLTLRLLVEPSLAGRASTALVKSPTLALEVEDARGRRRTWRIAAGYVANDFVISPLLDTPERYRAWFHGDMELATRSVRVLAADEDRWAFDETYRFELRRADGMAPPVEPDYRARRLAAIVKPAPDAIEAAAEPEMVALRAELETLVVGTPASLRFDLQAGRHRLSAFHGLHPRLADATRPAGANFVVVLRASDGTERELARRAVQPGERPVAARFTLDFDAAAGSTLFLRSEPAQAGAPAAVNAFWALVSVDRVP